MTIYVAEQFKQKFRGCGSPNPKGLLHYFSVCNEGQYENELKMIKIKKKCWINRAQWEGDNKIQLQR